MLQSQISSFASCLLTFKKVETLYVLLKFVVLAASNPSSVDIQDEDIEEEFRKLELELGTQDKHLLVVSQAGVDTGARESEASESAKSLCDALSGLKLSDNAATGPSILNSSGSNGENMSKNIELESA